MAIQGRPQDAKKKLRTVPKSVPARGKAASAALQKKAVSQKRLLILGGGACTVIILVLLIFFCSPRKETTPGTHLPAAPSPGLLKAVNTEDLPSIQAIRLQPPQPTRMEAVKADVVAASPDPGRIKYAYVWKVNDRIVADATGDTLNLSPFKKRDLVMVTVTPYTDDKAGYPVRSPVVVIRSITPSLELKAARQAIKAGEPLEFQLVSVHPDSDNVTFSLEAPIVPGMSIDSPSGKITWITQPDQKGTIPFGAAVEDADKTKVKKTFEIKVE